MRQRPRRTSVALHPKRRLDNIVNSALFRDFRPCEIEGDRARGESADASAFGTPGIEIDIKIGRRGTPRRCLRRARSQSCPSLCNSPAFARGPRSPAGCERLRIITAMRSMIFAYASSWRRIIRRAIDDLQRIEKVRSLTPSHWKRRDFLRETGGTRRKRGSGARVERSIGHGIRSVTIRSRVKAQSFCADGFA